MHRRKTTKLLFRKPQQKFLEPHFLSWQFLTIFSLLDRDERSKWPQSKETFQIFKFNTNSNPKAILIILYLCARRKGLWMIAQCVLERTIYSALERTIYLPSKIFSLVIYEHETWKQLDILCLTLRPVAVCKQIYCLAPSNLTRRKNDATVKVIKCNRQWNEANY